MTGGRVVEALPPGARLLHIGIPKTGTTALQNAAADSRVELVRHGVLYPGRRFNHHHEVSALMGKPLGWRASGQSVPAMTHWSRLQSEIDAARPGTRVLVSHEFASESDDDQARRFRDALGERLHVVVTLRGFAALLGSSWQQYVKSGVRDPFDRWLRKVLADPPDLRATPTFYRRNDQAAIVGRWVGLLGPDRVTVVVADRDRRSLLTDAFEDLLDLPRGMLSGSEHTGADANRGMSGAEVEMLRQLNVLLHRRKVGWNRYSALIRQGAVERLLSERRPGPDEPGPVLPGWAADQATERAGVYAEAIRSTGCRVVGDLTTLSAPVARRDGDGRPSQVPIEAAAEALAGLFFAAGGERHQPEQTVGGSPDAHRAGPTDRRQRMARVGRMNADVAMPDLLVTVAHRIWVNTRRTLNR